MEPSIFSFIWKHSRRNQLILLAFTVLTFPFLYVTLELPKRIINDAIGSPNATVRVLDIEMTQVSFLMLLCFGYLVSVLVHGLMKMRLNTMKGILSERLLRRFRYQLLERMTRFPRSYFQSTSQGELVSMITSEAEPMGGLMGDALAQPAFQAGQMMIILLFLFVQSPWFGLAGVALIPLQAWLIPMLQRQINQLNKARIKEIRHFSAEIGETAAGIVDLRSNGGWRYRLATFTDTLGRLFEIRFQIYQKKFFMKFLNNFITQLTPFFFYAVGGYLAIKGQITVGALVAALAAYKDLSSPWKELLDYYNQTQDMAVRWEVVTERFAPSGMLEQSLFSGVPNDIPRLNGDIELTNVSVRGADGAMVLEGLNLTLPKGGRIAVEIPSAAERTAFAELLARELLPTRGTICIAGHDLSTLHQAVVSARIGYARAHPYLFEGTIGDNLLMPLRARPESVLWDPAHSNRATIEARRSGNSPDSTRVDWLDPGLAGLSTPAEVRAWWFRLASALGNAELLFDRMLNAVMDPQLHPELAARIVALRDEVHQSLLARGLDKAVWRFDPDRFNPTIPLGGNLMFATPRRAISQQSLVAEKAFLALVMEHGLAAEGIAISQTLVETLHQTFGRDGTSHPLFSALGIEDDLYEQLVDIATRRRDKGDAALSEAEFSLLLTVPFALTAEQFGPMFPESFKKEILRTRKSAGMMLRDEVDDLFMPVTPETYLPMLTVLENLLYGRISAMAGLQAELIQDVVADVLRSHNMQQDVSAILFDVPTIIGASNLPVDFRERAALGRAAIKRPDILILNQPLSTQGGDGHRKVREQLGDLLPETTQIYIDDRFIDPGSFDMHVRIMDGRLEGVAQPDTVPPDDATEGDLRRKLRIIARTDLFAGLDQRSQRLLAFAAQWYDAPQGARVFAAGERADAAYLCLSGKAALVWVDPEGRTHHVSDVGPGRLIGDLSILVNEARQVDLTVTEDAKFLRIGAQEFRSVVENDKAVLLSLLRTIAGHLNGASDVLRAARENLTALPAPGPLPDRQERTPR